MNPQVKEATTSEASGPVGSAGRRSRGRPSNEEAGAKHKAGLGNQGGECHEEPGGFGGPDSAPERCEGRPDAGNRVRVMEQLVQGEECDWVCRVSAGRDRQGSDDIY